MAAKVSVSKSTKSTSKAKKTNLKFLRISTGEDVITELTEVPGKGSVQPHYILENPLKVIYAIMERPGVVAVNLISWVFPRITEEQRFVIYPKDVITMGDPSASLKEFYGEALCNIAAGRGAIGVGPIFEDHDDTSDGGDQMLKQFMSDTSVPSKRRLN